MARPIPLVISSLGTFTKEIAPKTLIGRAPAMNIMTGFHCISLNPKKALDRLPINWAIVRTGTAIVVPIVLVKSGKSSNAPPKPAAPDTAAEKTAYEEHYILQRRIAVCGQPGRKHLKH